MTITRQLQTLDDIRAERIAREERAAERAGDLPTGEYHAYDNFVRSKSPDGFVTILECETHWDACLVLLAMGEE